LTGTIKVVFPEKGWGFIKGEDGRDFFFHKKHLKGCSINDLSEGEPVTFEDAEGEKGLYAEDIYLG
jgi:cold shock protein